MIVLESNFSLLAQISAVWFSRETSNLSSPGRITISSLLLKLETWMFLWMEGEEGAVDGKGGRGRREHTFKFTQSPRNSTRASTA